MNNRISAQSKDSIRHYYSKKTSEIKSEVMKKLNLLNVFHILDQINIHS